MQFSKIQKLNEMRYTVGISLSICCNNSRKSNAWQMELDVIIILNKRSFDSSNQNEDWIKSHCFFLAIDFYTSK